MAYFTEISIPEAQAMMADSNPLILDARDAYSYKEMHIEGAMQAHGGLIEHLIQNQDTDRPVIVYCYQGNSSKDLAEIFGRSGFTSYSLKGGYTAWKKRDSLYAQSPYSESTTRWLTEIGFEPQALNITNAQQLTPLLMACRFGKTDCAQELINAGADVNQKDGDGNPPLWAAAYANNIELLEMLLGAGADINSQNGDGVTTLMYAASAGKAAVVSKLIAAGASTALENNDGFTALDLAASRDVLTMLKSAA